MSYRVVISPIDCRPIAQFAKAFGFSVPLVYAVLADKNKASRAESKTFRTKMPKSFDL